LKYLLLWILCAVVFAIGLRMLFRSFALTTSGVRIEATVIAIERYISDSRRPPTFSPTLEFVVPRGNRRMTGSPKTASTAYAFPKGSKVWIIAMPDGSDFALDRFDDLWLLPLIVTGIGATAVVVLFVCQFYARRSLTRHRVTCAS
jgi:hypothetical protein